MKHPFLVTEEDKLSISFGDSYKDQLALTEYLLVLQPSKELRFKIKEVKEQFAEKFDCAAAKLSSPQITMVKFFQFEMMEFKIVNKLKQLAQSIAPFIVDLEDFGSLPTHTIYINVTSKIAVTNAVKVLRQAQHLMKASKELRPYFITEPHITIARKLLPWQYEKGWLDMSNKNFTGRFIATETLLLKRNAGSKERYTKVNIFPFKGEQVKMEQGALF